MINSMVKPKIRLIPIVPGAPSGAKPILVQMEDAPFVLPKNNNAKITPANAIVPAPKNKKTA